MTTSEEYSFTRRKQRNIRPLFILIMQELALLAPGGKRTASIICRETTELFEIEKDTFLEVCPDIFETELNEKLQAVL